MEVFQVSVAGVDRGETGERRAKRTPSSLPHAWTWKGGQDALGSPHRLPLKEGRGPEVFRGNEADCRTRSLRPHLLLRGFSFTEKDVSGASGALEGR